MKTLMILFILLFKLNLYAQNSILIVNSYHKGYEWSDDVIDGMESVFYKNSDIDINILYMDSKRVTSKEYYNNLELLYKVQLKNRKYDLVIAVDRFAYDFVLKSYNSFFDDVPILAVGIENYSKENSKKYNLENKISVYMEKRDLKSNITLIENQISWLENLYIINDQSLNAKHTEPLIQEVMSKHNKKYNMNYIKADNLDALEKLFNKKEENAAILFIRFYKNSDGRLNKNQKIAKFIKNSKVPVFITDSIFINKGAVGGKIIDLKIFGENSGNIAVDMLKDFKPQIKVFEELSYIYDAQKLEEFNISLSNLYVKYKLINQSITFFDKHRKLTNFVFTISPFLILLILALIHNIYMRKKVENALQLTLQQSKLAEIGETFSSIAHQWKTPLIEITAIAQEKFILDDSSQKEDESYVKDIMTQVKYMNDTIENFQQFIMPSNKKTEFNVFDAITDMLNIVEHNMKYSYIDIKLSVKENTNLLILGYKNEFMQSILNIINNAKDELIKQDIKNRWIKINISNEGKRLVIVIEDNAGGIKAKNVYDIFEAYNSTKEKGHGIGLYMAKMIIEDKMGGFILVFNTKHGAYFKIMLG